MDFGWKNRAFEVDLVELRLLYRFEFFVCFDIGVCLGGIVRKFVDNGLFDFRVQVDYGEGILVRVESGWLWILLGIVFGWYIWYTDFVYLSYWEE